MKTRFLTALALIPAVILLAFVAGCNKIEYTKIDDPAYLRVFNDLNYAQNLTNKNSKYPSLVMIIDPVLDGSGMPTGGAIVGDYLDKRDPYAPPYPSHAGNSSSVQNPEYPGKESVLVGPILNGFDLSSWAQIPSGRHRFMFLYRPYNSIPFFQLDQSLKRDVVADTTIDFGAKEVYTMHVLQKDFNTQKNGVLLRQENFHKLPLSDSLAYVNFYNYSSKGFVEADYSLKPGNFTLRTFKSGVRENMNIFLTLYEGQAAPVSATILPNFYGKYLGTLTRNTESNAVATYYAYPLWASRNANGIRTDIWQRIEFLAPGLDVFDNSYRSANSGGPLTYGNYASMNCILNGKVDINGGSYLSNGYMQPNMLVNVHSGVNNPQTFATVSTVEIVNSNVYLTTVQRKYPVPIYK